MDSDHLRISTSQVYLIADDNICKHFPYIRSSAVLFLPACIIFLILPGHFFVSPDISKADGLSEFPQYSRSFGYPGYLNIACIFNRIYPCYYWRFVFFLHNDLFVLVAAAEIISGVINFDFNLNKITLRKINFSNTIQFCT